PKVRRAFEWFETVERICTRFDTSSEVMQLVRSAGRHVRVSTLLFEACAFALDLAEQTDGAFDPTIGATMEALGFDVEYRTGARAAADGYGRVHLRRLRTARFVGRRRCRACA